MPTAVILGGGISGLSAAYYLQKAQSKFAKIILLEASGHVGGWIKTTRFEDGACFEQGPRSMRPAGVAGINTLDLVHELGLSDDVLPLMKAHPAAKNRFTYINGNVHPLPSGINGVLKKIPPFSSPLIWSILKEPWRPKSGEDDESVDSFFRRRWGDDIASYTIDPLCRGVFAGDSRKLSMKSVFPMFHQAEQDRGSVAVGMIFPKSRKKMWRKTDLSYRAFNEMWSMWSLRTGMSLLSETLLTAIQSNPNVEVRGDSPCIGLDLKNEKIIVKTEAETIKADHVFSALPSSVLGDLLPPDLTDLQLALRNIPSVSAAVVNMEYDGNILQHEGFGHLLPSSQSGPILGVIYDSCTFPELGRTDKETTRLTCMFGGSWFDELVAMADGNLTEEFIKDLAVKTISEHLKTSEQPTRMVASINMNCIPQYNIGHSDILAKIDQLTNKSYLPISYLGSSYRGVSVNECIHNTKLEVERVRHLYYSAKK